MNLVWFREDLRIANNPALFHASENAPVAAIYLIDKSMWEKHHVAACRIHFLLKGIEALSIELKKLNIPLIVEEIANSKDLTTTLLKHLQQLKAKKLFFNKQYEVNEAERDKEVIHFLEEKDFDCLSYHDQTILPPGTVLTQEGEHYKVFTAYKRAWIQYFYQHQHNLSLLPSPKKQEKLTHQLTDLTPILKKWQAEKDLSYWPAGIKEAEKRLQVFSENELFHYDKNRDYPSLEGTSKLSPYLAAGMISASECFHLALSLNHAEIDSGNKGISTWMSELIWRDFYKHILVAVPRVSKHRAYQLKTEALKWKYDEAQFKAWSQGQTGFPIIDAAMRQLNQTGWMHNRLRMVTAMFFSKNLFFDWRLGEDYFIRHLIDGDLAANNGGWQWSASTGTDAVPYFRIFNPITQSERFDPNGIFIKQYCPELADFDEKSIHAPYSRNPLLAKASDYPEPIVDLQKTRAFAIEAYKKLK